MQFDPYHRWLGIPKSEQPADHYRLLGLVRFEDDPEAIRDAAERQIAHVRRYAKGEHREAANTILNELARAELTLIDPKRRVDYDAQLRDVAGASTETAANDQSAGVQTETGKPVAEKSNCPNCGAVFLLRAEQVGKTLQCPKCGLQFVGGTKQAEAVRPTSNRLPAAQTVFDTGSDPWDSRFQLPAANSAPAAAYPAAQVPSGSQPVYGQFPNTGRFASAGLASRRSSNKKLVVVMSAGAVSLFLLLGVVIAGVMLTLDSTEKTEKEVVANKSVPESDVSNETKKLSTNSNNSTLPSKTETIIPPKTETIVPPKDETNDGTFVAAPALLVAPFSSEQAATAQDQLAKHLKTQPTVESPSGISLVLIPPGEFMMGSDKYPAEKPVHKVQISKPFYLAKNEVTQDQWEKVMKTTPWQKNGEDQQFAKSGGQNAASYISWNDAVEFCRKLSVQEGKTYRLPTEAEWEYACRAGSQTDYCFGDSTDSLSEFAWFQNKPGDGTVIYAHPVGEKKPNAFGLHDMHGNVWEWCRDKFDANYYENSLLADPVNLDTGTSPAARGGASIDVAVICRSAFRTTLAGPQIPVFIAGLRVVCELDAGELKTLDKPKTELAGTELNGELEQAEGFPAGSLIHFTFEPDTLMEQDGIKYFRNVCRDKLHAKAFGSETSDSPWGIALNCRTQSYAVVEDCLERSRILTVAIWFRLQKVVDEPGTHWGTEFLSHYSNKGHVTFRLEGPFNTLFDGTEFFFNKSPPLADESWKFATMVCDLSRKSLRLYLDGEKIAEDLDYGPTDDRPFGLRRFPHPAGQLRIGTGIFYGKEGPVPTNFSGQIDEVTVFDRALEPEEVKQFYEWYLAREDRD